MPSDEHFAQVAGDYDRLRTSAGPWQDIAALTLERLGTPRRLLDVGCGTGRFAAFAAERLGARVWGVDVSAEMLREARARVSQGRVAFRQAPAERLPFKAGWFDAGHMHLVLHLVDDRHAALTELARVLQPGAVAAIVTFDPEHFHRFYLNRYFPSIESLDLARFPAPEQIAAALESVGFADVTLERIERTAEVPAADVLRRVEGRYISTLSLIAPDEYAAGLARLETDVAAGRATFDQELVWTLILARRT